MANMSDWLERNLASHIFGTGTFTKPGTLAIALCSGVPTDAMTGATIPELPNGNGYTRKTLDPSAANWLDPIGAGGLCENLVAVTWDAATASWGWVSGVAIVDSATYGQGNVLIHGALTTPKNIDVDDQFRFPSGSLDITLA